MKTTKLTLSALLLTLGSALLQAQQQQAKPPAPKNANGQEEEIQKPVPFSEQELRVLRSASSLPIERLQELLSVYEKLDNMAMMDALARAILRRDPDNADALRARSLVDPEEEKRPAGYLEELSKQVLAGKKIEDTDSIAIQANALTTDGRFDAAIKLLEAMRRNQFEGKTFPYLDDLGYAYSEAGRFADAIAAYEKITTEAGQSAEARAEAQKLLPSLRVRKHLDDLSKKAGGDMDKLVAFSEKAYRESPDDYDVIVFRIESLDRARRYDEAVKMLLEMKGKAKDRDAWPYQPTLAYAYFGARRYEEAIGAFREIQKSSAFDAATRFEAESMILEIRVNREIEIGMAAMKKNDIAGAKAVLDKLQRDYSIHPDVLGYHAIFLANTGKSKQAIAMLLAKKAEMQRQNLPFNQQDALADVYVEIKDYRSAIAATREIIDDPLYDDEMKGEAINKLHEIALTQTLEAGYKALEDGNRAHAKEILKHLQRFDPNDLEVKIFAASVALAYNHSAQARDDLIALKKADKDGGPFAGQESLASAYYHTGEWEKSFAAYREILDQPGYEPDDTVEARRQLRELRPLIRPTAKIDLELTHEDEGDVLASEASFSTGWKNDWRLTVFAREDWITLPGDSYFNTTDSTRFDAGVTVQRRFADGYFAEATVGGTNSGLLYGARVGKFANEGIGWWLGYMGNQRSNESPSLQALDGREDRAEFQIVGPIGDRWLMEFAAYYQWIRVSGDRLGEGYGFNGSLDYIIQTETRSRPEVTIGYFGEYHRFDGGSVPPSVTKEIRKAVVPTEEVRSALATTEEVRRAVAGSFGTEVLDSLVSPETNRHGIRLTVRKHFNDQWAGFVQVGGYYAFEEKSLDYTAAAGVEYYLSEAAMIYAEIRYDSNGRTSSSGVVEANLGALVSF